MITAMGEGIIRILNYKREIWDHMSLHMKYATIFSAYLL